MVRKIPILLIVFVAMFVNGCSKLDENFLGDTTQGTVASNSANTGILLQSLYNSLGSVFTTHLTVFPLQELCTDEAIFPTRGGDWDDNGVWRVLHQQKWTSNHEKTKSLSGLNKFAQSGKYFKGLMPVTSRLVPVSIFFTSGVKINGAPARSVNAAPEK